MGTKKEDIKKDFEVLRERFKKTNLEEFRQGDWFASFVKWMLENYSTRVDATYIRKKYPGIKPGNQAKKAIKLASRYCGVAGGVSAAFISAAQVATIGTAGSSAPITVPAIALGIMGDVAYTTRFQLRTTYDLSVIHGAPLAMDDVEDCYFVFMAAMGVNVYRTISSASRAVGPKLLTYNLRKLMRSGVRGALVKFMQKVGGVRLAKKLTEKAMLRLLVPGVSIPIASTANYYFTKHMLKVANKRMMRRGAVIQPLIQLYKRQKDLDSKLAMKALIATIESGNPDEWSDLQMDCVRHTQSFLQLKDEDLAELESYLARDASSVAEEFPEMAPQSYQDLRGFLIIASSFFPDGRYDKAYAKSIEKLTRGGRSLEKAIESSRRKYK